MSSASKNMNPDEVLEELARGSVLGATMFYPQDRVPLVVIKSSKTGFTIEFLRVRSVGIDTGHEPARYSGPFPVWDHDYTPDELELYTEQIVAANNRQVARWSDQLGCYQMGGVPIRVGVANYHRDFSY